MGSQGGPMGGIAPGSYSFSAVYANSQVGFPFPRFFEMEEEEELICEF